MVLESGFIPEISDSPSPPETAIPPISDAESKSPPEDFSSDPPKAPNSEPPPEDKKVTSSQNSTLSEYQPLEKPYQFDPYIRDGSTRGHGTIEDPFEPQGIVRLEQVVDQFLMKAFSTRQRVYFIWQGNVYHTDHLLDISRQDGKEIPPHFKERIDNLKQKGITRTFDPISPNTEAEMQRQQKSPLDRFSRFLSKFFG